MKRKVQSIIFMMLIFSLLTGCAKVADEKKMQEELEESTYAGLLADGEKIDQIEIVDRITDKKGKLDIVTCNITTEDADIKYLKRVTLNYSLQKKGWILDSVNVAPEYEWGKKPLRGVSEEKIENLLYNQVVEIEGEEWVITPDMVKNISIDHENADLENSSDTVTFDLTLSSKVEDAQGQLTVVYVFFNTWTVASIDISKTFTTTINADYAPDYTANDFIAEIAKQELELVDNKNEGQLFTFSSTPNQTVSILEEEITDFKIDSQQSSEKGMMQTYNCSCILNKPQVTFILNPIITCYYDSPVGWSIQSTNITYKLQEINILGEWTGTYTNVGNVTGSIILNITDIDSTGRIEATYSYTPDEISRFVQPGSYKLSGQINKNTMYIKLDEGDWIEEPAEHLYGDKHDVIAILCVDEGVIRGAGHNSSPFEVKQ